jgi:uncharacterized protein (TIGR00730 family)
MPFSDQESMKAFQLSKDSWRIFKIISEFVEGFEKMTSIGPSVALFGSARLGTDTPYYNMAVEVSRQIASKGLAIITGGGPGIMEAANKGAVLAGKPSCGLCIDLPFEHDANSFVDRQWRLRFRYFFVRKVMFVRYARAYVILPGGVGTLDEMFEAVTLMQTQKTLPFPVFLMGKDYWSGLIDWLREVPLAHGCLKKEDLDRFIISDDPEYIANQIEKSWKETPHLANF